MRFETNQPAIVREYKAERPVIVVWSAETMAPKTEEEQWSQFLKKSIVLFDRAINQVHKKHPDLFKK